MNATHSSAAGLIALAVALVIGAALMGVVLPGFRPIDTDGSP